MLKTLYRILKFFKSITVNKIYNLFTITKYIGRVSRKPKYIILCSISISLVIVIMKYTTKTNDVPSAVLFQLLYRVFSQSNLTIEQKHSIFHYDPPNMKEPAHKRKVKPFDVQINHEERAVMYHLLRVFHEQMISNRLIYMIDSGTLLGSFRHHDFIPWDDDIDVLVRKKDRDTLRDLFSLLTPAYTLVRADGHDKIYANASYKTNEFDWLWPYLDISFYEENDTHIWDHVITYGHKYVYPKSIIFPLKRRPLYNMWLMAPKDTFATLVWHYGFNSVCKQYGYSHIVEDIEGPEGKVECSILGLRYPFVTHLPDTKNRTNKVLERLMFGDLIIREEVVDEPSYAIVKPYTFDFQSGYRFPKNIEIPNS